jgi:subtilisin family serine protease
MSTTSRHFFNAIQFAYQNGAEVINLSLAAMVAGPANDATAEAAVNAAIQNGAVVVTVIGNADSGSGRLIDGSTFSSIPGQYASKPGVIGVGSYDTSTGLKSAFSHYSTLYAEIGAPGAEAGTNGVFSTLPASLGSYGRLAGTSQAAPLVSAAAGLIIASLKKAYGTAPSPSEVESVMMNAALKTSTLAPYFKDGNRLDLLNLAQQIGVDYPLTQTLGITYSPASCSE